jgi:hypothetical protein
MVQQFAGKYEYLLFAAQGTPALLRGERPRCCAGNAGVFTPVYLLRCTIGRGACDAW